jgi:hypothetical protein
VVQLSAFTAIGCKLAIVSAFTSKHAAHRRGNHHSSRDQQSRH